MNDYDQSHWHYIQAPEEMFLLRKHDYDDASRHLLTKWLKLERPNLAIVEMGSGSGYFTEQLLRMANNPQIICVEPDDVLRSYAEKILRDKVTLKKGFVEDPPLINNSADLVICHVLLCNVPDIKAAVNGMKKAAKLNGTVCSIELVFLGGYSSDPRASLIVEGHSANIEGAWIRRRKLIHYPKEYPYNKFIYPKVFSECGLGNIRIHALAQSYYSGDHGRTREENLQEAKEWLDLLENHKDRYEANLRRAGWKQRKIRDLFKAWQEFHEEEIRNPGKASEDSSVYMKCSIVTTGQKE